MKKRIVILGIALLAFVATFAVCEAVTGNNWVGYVKVQVPPGGQFTIVGVNFEAIGGGGIPLNEFISTNSLNGNVFFTKADNVFLYDTAKAAYNQFYYHDGTFKNATQIGGMPAGTATNPIVHNGDAFWLKSAGSSTETNEVFLMGEVMLDSESEQTMLSSFQLFANPYPTSFDINNDDYDWIAAGAKDNAFYTKADNIFIWNGAQGEYDQYFLDVDGKWHDLGDNVAANAIIPVGHGAWYKARGTFTNLYTRPYSLD